MLTCASLASAACTTKGSASSVASGIREASTHVISCVATRCPAVGLMTIGGLSGDARKAEHRLGGATTPIRHASLMRGKRVTTL